ncbi:MAG TPA: hypothetical protein VHN74_20285 [Candidatus Angelobacter sp.]|nr:hypothetical protein [Candidatus Angelobacter sp.]
MFSTKRDTPGVGGLGIAEIADIARNRRNRKTTTVNDGVIRRKLKEWRTGGVALANIRRAKTARREPKALVDTRRWDGVVMNVDNDVIKADDLHIEP